MSKIYMVDGKPWEVAPHLEEQFLTDMKAQGKTPTLKSGEQGKTNGDATTDASATPTTPASNLGTDQSQINQTNTGSPSETGSSVSQDDMDESTRLMSTYRNQDESTEDFYNRIIPSVEDSYENIYSPAHKGNIPKKVSKTTIDGITKTSRHGLKGSYTNQDGEQASQDEILRFEELNILNDIHKRASDIRSRQAGRYDNLSDSEIIRIYEEGKDVETLFSGRVKVVGEGSNAKVVRADSGIDTENTEDFDPNLNFDFEEYQGYKQSKLNEAVQKEIASQTAKLNVDYEKGYNEIAQSLLPDIQESVNAKYQPQIKDIETTIVNKYRKEFEAKQEELLEKYQAQADRATTQEQVDQINSRMQRELQQFAESSDQRLQEEYSSTVHDELGNLMNADIQAALNANEDIQAYNDQAQVEFQNTQDNIINDYVENFKPTSNHFSEEELNDIGISLDQMGFADASGPEKKYMLQKVINDLDKVQGGTSEDIEDIKNEFWYHFYDKLSFTREDDGTESYSQFALKDMATSALQSAEAKLAEEAKKYEPIKTKIGSEGGKPIYSTITPEQQALANNSGLSQTIMYSKQVLENPEAASDYGVVNFFRGVGSLEGYKYIPILGGVVDLAKSGKLYELAKKENRTPQEDRALQMYMVKNQSDAQVRKLSTGYNAGAMAAESLAFMGEMILTSGTFSAAKTATQKIIKKGLTKSIDKVVGTQLAKGLRFAKGSGKMMFVPKNARTKVVDTVGDAIAFVAATGAQTALNPQRYVTSTFERMTPEMAFSYTTDADELINHVSLSVDIGSKDNPDLKDGENFSKAFARAFGLTWSEYATERMGELIPGMGKAALKKVGITKSPEFIKRLALGRYMRKMGLDQAEAFTHFTKNQMGWNGIFGEITEEMINIPLSNLIVGDDLTKGFEDTQQLKEMGISIAASSLAFGGGSAIYNRATGRKSPSYFVDNQRFKNEKSALAYLRKMKKDGRLNENTDIEISNDYVAFDNVSNFLEGSGISNKIIKTGGKGVSVGDIAAAEVEMMDALPKEKIDELENIDNEISTLEASKDELNQGDKSPATNSEVEVLDNKIKELKKLRDDIVSPIKDVIKKKKTKAYKEGLKNLKNILGETAYNEIVTEAQSETEAREMLEKAIVEEQGLDEIGGEYFDSNGGKVDVKSMVDKNMGAHGGFYVDPKTGAKRIFINKEAALEGAGSNVAGHEFLHYFLSETLNANPQLKLAFGKALYGYVKNLDPRQIRDTEFRNRVLTYQQNQGEVVSAEETLNILSDAMANGTYQYNETALTKLGDIIRRIMSSFGVRVKFESGKDVFNFIKDYNRAFAKGKFSKGMQATMEQGVKVGEGMKQLGNIALGQVVKGKLKDMGISLSQDASEKVQDIYKPVLDLQTKAADKITEEEKNTIARMKESVAGLIAMEYRGMAETIFNRALANAASENIRQDLLKNKEDIIADILYDPGTETAKARTVLGLVKDFDPAKHKYKNVAAYINQFLPERAKEVFKKRGVEMASTKSISDEKIAKELEGVKTDTGITDTVEEEENKRKVKLKDRLLVTPRVKELVQQAKDDGVYEQGVTETKAEQQAREEFSNDKIIGNKLKGVNIREKGYKQTPLIATQIVADLLGIPVKNILDNSNLANSEKKPQVKNAQRFISKNWDLLLSMLPNGGNSLGKSTGVNKVFLDRLYNKKSVRSKTKAGLNVQMKRPDIRKSEFLELFGFDKDGKPTAVDRNTSARIIAIAKQLDRAMSNQIIRELLMEEGSPLDALATIADGKSGILFSAETQPLGAIQRQIPESSIPILWDNIPKFANVFGGKEIYSDDIDAVRLALEQTYSDYPDIMDNIEALTKAVHNALKGVKVPKKDIGKRIAKIEDIIIKRDQDADTKVAVFFNSDSSTDIQSDIDRQQRRRDNDVLFINDMWQKFKADYKNEQEAAAAFGDFILNMAGHSSTATRIADKRFIPGPNGKLIENPDYVPFTINKKGKKVKQSFRGQSYLNKPDFISTVVESIKGEDGKPLFSLVSGKVTYKGNVVNKGAFRPQNSEALLKDVKEGGDKMNARNKEVISAREFLNEYIAWHVDKYNNGIIDNSDLAMVASALLSHMDSALARAAMPAYIAEGMYNTKEKLVYEHMQPRVAVLLSIFDAHINGEGISDINDFLQNYEVAVIPKSMDDLLKSLGLVSSLAPGQTLQMPAWYRYFNSLTMGSDLLLDLNPINTEDTTKLKAREAWQIANQILTTDHRRVRTAKQAVSTSINFSMDGGSKGMSTFDFDETLIIEGKNFVVATKGNETIKISSDQWPIQGPALAAQGYKFDFSDFANVRGGKEGPLLQKMKNQIKKYGSKNVFVLTARQQDAAGPIHEWLKTQGINIPIENITGLGKSEGSAKGEWMLQKFAEGYNDMYFVDDALPNVKAVKDVLDRLDIKSKVVQAKINFSVDGNAEFNSMLDRSAGVPKDKIFSDAQARRRGAKSDKFRFFVPPSAEDFKGLLYSFLGKGKQGDADMQFFKEHLLDPFAKGIRDINFAKQRMSEEYKTLRNKMPDVHKRLSDKIPNTDYTLGDAIRVFLWNTNGIEVPGLSEQEVKTLSDYIENKDLEARAFAETLGVISRSKDGYVLPDENWVVGSIGSDLFNQSNKINRKDYLEEWKNNVDIIFSPENLNKIEAVYGTSFRDALEDILFRMETGSNRAHGNDKVVNGFMDWINGSVGAVMFFNTRSAILQTLSTVNFIDWNDNNIFQAAKAFANQPQYWKDFITLFNSDMLKQRRAGMSIDVNLAELSNAVAKSSMKDKSKAALRYLLQIGFTPTQIADSFAIASGGATFYRNKVNKYLKEGMSQKEAEAKAFDEFQEIAEETQQSSRPDLISQQQAGTLGRLILAWQNTPMQYTRLTKKAISDLANGRGDWRSHVSRILYYGAIQNFIFGSLQTGLAFLMFGGDEDEEKTKIKTTRVLNGALDTILRGTGVYGAMVSTLKNTIMKYMDERDKPYGRRELSKVALEAIQLSPPIGSKLRKVMNAIYSYEYNKGVPEKMGLSIDNPMLNVVGNVVEATTNFPLDRGVRKSQNLEEAINGNHEMWKRVALIGGWDKWGLNIQDEEIQKAREEVKIEKKEKKKAEKKAEKEQKKKEEEQKKKDEGIKQVRCSGIKSNGQRCSIMVETKAKSAKCMYHKAYKEGEASDRDNDGIKEYRCKAITGSGKRCKNRTENTNKKCYAHQ